MSGADGVVRFPADRITAVARHGDPLWNDLAIGRAFGTAMALFADRAGGRVFRRPPGRVPGGGTRLAAGRHRRLRGGRNRNRRAHSTPHASVPGSRRAVAQAMGLSVSVPSRSGRNPDRPLLSRELASAYPGPACTRRTFSLTDHLQPEVLGHHPCILHCVAENPTVSDRRRPNALPEETPPRFAQRCSFGIALLVLGVIGHVMVGQLSHPTPYAAADVPATASAEIVAGEDEIVVGEDATELLAALRTGYTASYMEGIVGRAAFHDGMLYVENRNRFGWYDVRIVLDQGTTHAVECIVSSQVYRLRPHRKPATVHVAASIPLSGLEGMMSFGPPGLNPMPPPRRFAADVGD